ncbi:MAG: hypothetical protein ACPL2D_03765 [Ignavibacteria bacterium]
MNKTVAILGLFDTGLAVGRALGRKGVCVYGYDYNLKNSGFKSKYIIGKKCPSPVEKPDELLRQLLKDTEGKTRRILIPAADEFVFFINDYREFLERSYEFIIPDKSIINSIRDKYNQIRFFENLGFKVPESFKLNIQSELDAISFCDTKKYVIKPINHYRWRQFFKGKVLRVADNLELNRLVDLMFEKEVPFFIQEVVPGNCVNNVEISFYYNNKGIPISTFIFRKLRQYPDEYGYGCAIESFEDEKLSKFLIGKLNEIGWRGFANVELKYDSEQNEYKFIEINPRVWQQIGVAESLGINFPLMMYEELCNKVYKNFYFPSKLEFKAVDPIPDLISAFKLIIEKRLTFTEWFKSRNGSIYFGTYAKDDLRPFFASLQYGLMIIKIIAHLLRHLLKNIKDDTLSW